MFLETNSFLKSSNELVIFSTSAMCCSLHCGEKQLSCPGRTSHQFVVHVYIGRYGKWTETNGSVFFLPAILKRTNLRLSPDFNRRLKTLLTRVNRKTETAQKGFPLKHFQQLDGIILLKCVLFSNPGVRTQYCV